MVGGSNSLIPLTFRLYPDYSSISHSRFLSKNGDGVGILYTCILLWILVLYGKAGLDKETRRPFQ